jgi:hypothetical protein
LLYSEHVLVILAPLDSKDCKNHNFDEV